MTWNRDEVLVDYRTAWISRHASLRGRQEVLSGKAKFGIFGDGKEVAQLAMARSFQKGDWRSGYYRDQTFMMALGLLDVPAFFAQLYAHADLAHDPSSQGRQMNNHFATHFLDEAGNWLCQTDRYHSSADISPTAGQMPRLVGLAYASKLYRNSPALQKWSGSSHFSLHGNEIAFGTIGNASTSEGLFWESLNAAAVLQIPMLISVWDDDYGISVSNEYQTCKQSISRALAGFEFEEAYKGVRLFRVAGHDYAQLRRAYEEATTLCRTSHVPSLIHVHGMTQPQGHSTSGSHERYKSKERLAYETDMDCLQQMRIWMLAEKLASSTELDAIEAQAEVEVEAGRAQAWSAYQAPLLEERKRVLACHQEVEATLTESLLQEEILYLEKLSSPLLRNLDATLFQSIHKTHYVNRALTEPLRQMRAQLQAKGKDLYSRHLYTETHSCLYLPTVLPAYDDASPLFDGRQIIQQYFDKKLAQDPRLFIIGEDIGKLGGVNLEFDDLQDTHGEWRVTDTGIREATILGQGFGAAFRGLRPVVDIQYLDYVLYCLQGLSDDVATLQYRSAGRQAAPTIVRTKGHRLEGIWHTGSPMGVLIHALRGMYLCVPRNCVQAAGMYNTLLQGDDSAIVIEVLNGYRVKERCPSNLGSYTIPLGVCEILHPGTDITIVTYGANVRIAQQTIPLLEARGISCELIDIQTLMPFDRKGMILQSLTKTHAVVFFDEDVQGGGSAFMMQQVLELQGGYEYLDAAPRTVTAQAHRSAYGSDGDYYSKPGLESLFETVYSVMHERDPKQFVE